MLGAEGITDATKYAILNANYKSTFRRTLSHFLYWRKGRAAHEMILDCRVSKKKVLKCRYCETFNGLWFHAPTVSFQLQEL
jgi:glycine dehydrogenase